MLLDREAQGRRLRDLAGAHVRRHDDDRIAEVHRAALRVGQAALLQDLEQDVEDVGVGLLDLVEQHDRVGTLTHGLRQLAALVEADVARRRTHETRDTCASPCTRTYRSSMSASSESNRNSASALAKLRLAHAGRAEEDERARGALRVLQPARAAADGLRAPPSRPRPGPITRSCSTSSMSQQLARSRASVRLRHRARPSIMDTTSAISCSPSPRWTGRTRRSSHFFSASSRSDLSSVSSIAQLGGAARSPARRWPRPSLPRTLAQLCSSRSRSSVRQRHVANAHARAGLVNHVDGLVGQEAVLDVAVRPAPRPPGAPRR